MKLFKTLTLPYPELATELTYDTHSNSLLVSGQSLSIVSDKYSHDAPLYDGTCLKSNSSIGFNPYPPYFCFASSSNPSATISKSQLSLRIIGNVNKC